MHLYLLLTFVGGEILDLVGETGAVAKMVLLVLLAFSLISWAIILSKWSGIRRARVQSGRFIRAFRKAQRLQDVGAVAEQFRPSPLVGVFENGFEEYRRQGGVSTGAIRSPLAIQRAMQIASSEEMTRLERNLSWLAITGAVTPFVGLFGTVWGIIDAFHGLGERLAFAALEGDGGGERDQGRPAVLDGATQRLPAGRHRFRHGRLVAHS